MVSLKEITVKLQIWVGGQWKTCEEFDGVKSVKNHANSATKLTTYVECMPGQFRFLIALSEHFEWTPEANALGIDLTFDEGDPINQYRVVVLKPTARELSEHFGLRVMDNDFDELSLCLENIAMPSEAESDVSLWYETSFDFRKYTEEDLTKFGTSKSRSKYKGKLNIDIRPCVAKRDHHQHASITLNPKLEYRWSSVRPQEEVTLKPTLKSDTNRICSNARHYKCIDSKDVKPVSFIFHYREPNTCYKIQPEDVDVVIEDQSSLKKETPEPALSPPNRHLTVETVSLATPSIEQVGNVNDASTGGQLRSTWSEDSSDSTIVVNSYANVVQSENMSSEDAHSDGFIALAQEAGKMYQLLGQARREEAWAERERLRQRRQDVRREIEEMQDTVEDMEITVMDLSNALTAARAELSRVEAYLHGLKLEDSSLGEKDQRLERQALGRVLHEEEEEKLTTATEGIQDLLNHLYQQHENLKRRRIS